MSKRVGLSGLCCFHHLGNAGPAKTYGEALIPKTLLDSTIVAQVKTEYGLGFDMEADSPATT